jgi:hypothetical protein
VLLKSARVQLKTGKIFFTRTPPSAIRPVPHGPGIPVPVPPEILQDTPVDSDKEDIDSDQDLQCDPCSTEPQLLSQSELNDLVRDLGLPKDSAEVLQANNRKNVRKVYSVRLCHELKVHFQNAHLDYFPENLGAVSEE